MCLIFWVIDLYSNVDAALGLTRRRGDAVKDRRVTAGTSDKTSGRRPSMKGIHNDYDPYPSVSPRLRASRCGLYPLVNVRCKAMCRFQSKPEAL